MKEKIYNYFYIVNNLLNGHFYLGVHSTDKLADGYFGSGKVLKKVIALYGKENFELVPLKFFKTRKELMDYERTVVNDRFLAYYKGICYNLKRGGEDGCEKRFTDEELKNHDREQHLKWREQNPEKKKEMQRKYEQSTKGKEARRRANQSPKVKESRRRYNQSQKGKESQRRYKLKKKAEKQSRVGTK